MSKTVGEIAEDKSWELSAKYKPIDPYDPQGHFKDGYEQGFLDGVKYIQHIIHNCNKENG